MVFRTWVQQLPPIAQRDATIRELRKKLRQVREKNQKLRETNDQLRGKAAELRELLRRPRDNWAPPPRARAIEMVRATELFDPEWYRTQLPAAEAEAALADTATHYIDHGERAGHMPHPAFIPSYYATRGTQPMRLQQQIERRPLVHYLDVGAAEGRSPHPLFDAKAYLAAHPESADVPGGPLAHFLARTNSLAPTEGATGARWDDPSEFRAAARKAAAVLAATRGFEHVERDRKSFDVELEARVKAELRSTPLPVNPPTVSVVVPTKDRADMLEAALTSVLKQTYPHWQLIVVDDGSKDDTPALLRRYTSDERVEVVRHDAPRGVAAARNAGLRRATGRYVAYLDSDNTWFPDFLELMVRHLVQSGDQVAYAVTALVEEGGKERRLFRGLPFDRDHLRERNYIDCIVVVHERSLLDVVGAFDETLRRNVDWDLLIRLAEHTDFTLVPVVATQYDVWSERGERITTNEPMAYRYVVRQRSLVDLGAVARGAADRDSAVLSVVITLNQDAVADQVVSSVRRMLDTAADIIEVVIVDAKASPGAFTAIQTHLAEVSRVSIHRLTQPVPSEVARNVGLAHTQGRDVAFLADGLWTEADWDVPLRRALSTHSVVQPLVLTPGGAVWSAGIEYLSNGHWYLPWSGFAGDAPEVRHEREISAAAAAAVVVRASDIAAVGGFDPLLRDDIYGGELSSRVLRLTGGTAACVPSSVIAWREPVKDSTTESGLRRARDNQRRERELWQQAGSRQRKATTLSGYRLVGFDRARNTQVAPEPLVVHDRPTRPLRWAIKIGAPTVERRTNWGDWHFAESLRDSLERLGHEATIDCKESWYRPSSHLDDVVLQLRGVSVYEVNPAHTNVSWTISHPDRVSGAELSDYDLAFGASPRWCEDMTRRLGRPVDVLMQCTDHRRFHPVEPDGRRAHEVLAVANARGLRPSVAAALDAGVIPAVYGVRWEGLLPDGAWKGRYIPNADLPAVYCAAGVVLNDHWDDMREMGLLSNRLFDLTACEARVVSDYLPELSEVFSDVVLTYDDERDIGSAIRQQLDETPERAHARQELGARIRAEHTFDARAQQLSEAVRELHARQGTTLSR